MDTETKGSPIAKVPIKKKIHCPSCRAGLSRNYFTSPVADCPACGTSIRLPDSDGDTVSVSRKRSDTRCQIALRVNYETAKGFKEDYTRNVSRGGMFIATASTISIGTKMQLELFLPDLKDPILLSVEVVHNRNFTSDEKDSGIGVKFIDIDPLSRNILLNYLKTIPDCE